MASGNLLRSNRNNAQCCRLSVGQVVHSMQRRVEARNRMINRGHRDAASGPFVGGVGEFPAAAARGGVPSRDCGCGGNVWEGGERREVAVACGFEAISAIGAGNGGKGGAAGAVAFIVAKRGGGSTGGQSKSGGCDDAEDGDELHYVGINVGVERQTETDWSVA